MKRFAAVPAPESDRVRAVPPIFRVLVVWLLALALPAQGLAAVRMMHCAPGGAPMHASPQAGAQGGHAGHPGHADRVDRAADAAAHGPAHAHDVGHASGHELDHDATLGPASGPQASSDAAPGANLADQKCSACAACCGGAALSPYIAGVPEFAPDSGPLVQPLARAVSFLTAGLERPPRPDLA